MKNEGEIIKILCEAGNDGLSVQKIALHLYNASNTLFAPVRLDDVRRSVQAWLLRNSRSADSLVCRMPTRGHYRLNMQSAAACQLMLDFSANVSDRDITLHKDSDCGDMPTMLSLFDDMQ